MNEVKEAWGRIHGGMGKRIIHICQVQRKLGFPKLQKALQILRNMEGSTCIIGGFLEAR